MAQCLPSTNTALHSTVCEEKDARESLETDMNRERKMLDSKNKYLLSVL